MSSNSKPHICHLGEKIKRTVSGEILICAIQRVVAYSHICATVLMCYLQEWNKLEVLGREQKRLHTLSV